MLGFFEEAFEEAKNLLTCLSFDRNNNVHRVVMSLYATIMEQVGEALNLLLSSKHSTIDIILRANFEAYVDLNNLCDNATYLANMQASYHEQWIKLARAGTAGNNPFLAPFASPEAQMKLAEHEAALQSLVDGGNPPLSIYDKFRRAGMENEYRSIYNSLCNESHNNIRALTRRHFRLNADGNPTLVIFDHVSDDDLAPSLMSYTGILISSTKRVHDYFETAGRDAVNGLAMRHSEVVQKMEVE